MLYPAINTQVQPTDEIKIKSGRPIGTVMEYWQWAHSDLIDNAERGALAEYIVACAIGGKGTGRINWSKYDLTSSDGITVEVKASAYLQCWGQDKLSNITFGIRETFGYDSADNTYEKEKKRQADVYVFCVVVKQNCNT